MLGDVRDRVPGVAEVLRRLAADVAHRLALDLAPLGEVGQRLAAHAVSDAGAACGAEPVITPFDVRLQVLDADAAALAAAGHLADVDAELARHAPHRRRRRRAPAHWLRPRRLRRGCGAAGCGRAPRLMSTTSPRFWLAASSSRAVCASGCVGLSFAAVFRRAFGAAAGRLRLGRRPSGSARLLRRQPAGCSFGFAASSAPSLPSPRRSRPSALAGRPLPARAIVQRQHQLADLDLVALLDLDLA